MRVSVLAVGRLKVGPEKLLVQDYETRIVGLSRKAGILKFSVADASESRNQTAAARVKDEAHYFARTIATGAFTIVLDERGKALSSAGFADLMRRHIDAGTADMALLIGGPDGHAASTRENCGFLLSFGAMTWPHRLVRIMLLEQIYRALTIMVDHPYHRA
jgi:23S rRNA (pseudouridine1915-N3)-methyltransferase